MVSLDPELSKLFLVLMSTRHPSGPQNGTTLANFLKRELKTSFLQHESKIEDSLRFFPDNGPRRNMQGTSRWVKKIPIKDIEDKAEIKSTQAEVKNCLRKRMREDKRNGDRRLEREREI